MDIVIEVAVEAAGELLSAGIDAVVDKAVKHKSEYKSEYRRKHTMAIKSLIINPGSTSTKIGVFEDENLLFEETLRHSTEEISKYDTIFEQKDFRKKIITDLLAEKNCDLKSFNVIVGRGGLLKPIPSGTYAVTDDLLEDLKVGVQGQHASNLGGILAREIGDEIGVPSYIVDPVVVDELMPIARYSGLEEIPRGSIFHALNQKAVAKRYAKEAGKPYESLRLVVVHMGGGVSVGAHEDGKVVDVFTNPKEKTTREFVGSIISHKLPEEAWRHLNVQKEWSDNLHPIIRLTFTGNVTDEPIVAGMIRRFGIDVSILFGGVDYIQEVSFGHLIIVLDGDRGSEEQAIEYLKGLPIGSEVIGYVAANS